MIQTQNICNTVSDYIKNMQPSETVCIKGKESKTGFNASVLSLKECIETVVEMHPNKRGSITLTLEEKAFKGLARKHGYNI